jgi:hypothetical protein
MDVLIYLNKNKSTIISKYYFQTWYDNYNNRAIL